MGNINISLHNSLYNVTCVNCSLANYITQMSAGTKILVLYQPAFIMLPVNFSGPWYDDKGVQLWKEVNTALAINRTKRFIGL